MDSSLKTNNAADASAVHPFQPPFIDGDALCAPMGAAINTNVLPMTQPIPPSIDADATNTNNNASPGDALYAPIAAAINTNSSLMLQPIVPPFTDAAAINTNTNASPMLQPVVPPSIEAVATNTSAVQLPPSIIDDGADFNTPMAAAASLMLLTAVPPSTDVDVNGTNTSSVQFQPSTIDGANRNAPITAAVPNTNASPMLQLQPYVHPSLPPILPNDSTNTSPMMCIPPSIDASATDASTISTLSTIPPSSDAVPTAANGRKRKISEWPDEVCNNPDVFQLDPDGNHLTCIPCYKSKGKRNNGKINMRRPFSICHWKDHCLCSSHLNAVANIIAEEAERKKKKAKPKQQSPLGNFFQVKKKKATEDRLATGIATSDTHSAKEPTVDPAQKYVRCLLFHDVLFILNVLRHG